MTKMRIVMLAVAMVVGGLGMASVNAADKAAKTITVINLGALDAAGVKSLQAYLAANIALPVRVAAAAKNDELDESLEAVAKERKANDGIVIALAPLKNIESIILADTDHALALVNTTALAKVAKSPIRVNQAVMRALAASLGVGTSLDPHCVYRTMESPAEYDKLGGNFSPPILQQVLIAADQHGVATTLPPRKRAEAKK